MIKKYISERIPYQEYSKWTEKKKVVIQAPTGMGKTTFVLEYFLLHCMYEKKRVLILCNRRLLREQYEFELAKLFERYAELVNYVEVKTYQEIAEMMKNGMKSKYLLKDFDVVIADEAHYFYQDSEFNPFGTYALLQGLILAGVEKTMVFVSATFKEFLPILQEAFQCCWQKLFMDDNFFGDLSECKIDSENIYDFSGEADFQHFHCVIANEVDEIWHEVAKSEKKSIIFIDNKEYAEKLKEQFQITWGLKSEDVYLLNADIIDDKMNDVEIRTLTIAHKVLPKILITTSVLDNGVSIHDDLVGNVVVATESKVNFFQMIGRIRTENCEFCNLYIFPHKVEYYEKRLGQYKKKLELFNECEKMLQEKDFALLCQGWYSNGEEGQTLRNTIVITEEEMEFIQKYRNKFVTRGSGIVLAINTFAKEKVGNNFLIIENFLRLALENPELVAREQFSWIRKNEEEIEVLSSSYKQELGEALQKELLKIIDLSNEEFSKIKTEIANKYQKILFPKIRFNKNTFSTEKFEKVCKQYDLTVKVVKGKEGKNRYSVVREDQIENGN